MRGRGEFETKRGRKWLKAASCLTNLTRDFSLTNEQTTFSFSFKKLLESWKPKASNLTSGMSFFSRFELWLPFILLPSFSASFLLSLTFPIWHSFVGGLFSLLALVLNASLFSRYSMPFDCLSFKLDCAQFRFLFFFSFYLILRL